MKSIKYKILSSLNISHGTFTRHGGYSEGPFKGLNVGENVGDKDITVENNRNLIKNELQLTTLISAKQTHGTTIIKVDSPPSHPLECDALMTNKPGVGLMIKHADCQAALVYDPINHAIAAIHCGWRGNVRNIYQATIEQMINTYSSDPGNLLIAISPSLGPCHSEFIHYKKELPESFWRFEIKPTKPNHFDLWAISRWQLESCGVKPDHIEISGLCTYADRDLFFSYRRDRITGRHGSVIAL